MCSRLPKRKFTPIGKFNQKEYDYFRLQDDRITLGKGTLIRT